MGIFYNYWYWLNISYTGNMLGHMTNIVPQYMPNHIITPMGKYGTLWYSTKNCQVT